MGCCELQAVKLLVKGVPFYSPPSKAYQRELLAEGEQAEDEKRAVAREAAHGTAAADSSVSANVSDSSNGHTYGAGAIGKGGRGLCPMSGAAGAGGHSHPRNGLTGTHFLWQEAPGWPWREG